MNTIPGVLGTSPELPAPAVRRIKTAKDHQKIHKNVDKKSHQPVRKHGQK